MSYARSPLLVCSITMGTSIVCGSLQATGHTSSPEGRSWSGTQPALCGSAVQRIQGLLVADAMTNSIQPAILRQTSPDLFEGLLRLCGQRLQFAVELFVT